MERLTDLFPRFSITVREVYSGILCKDSVFAASPTLGYMHVVHQGRLQVLRPRLEPLVIDRPTLLFFPRSCRHTLHTVGKHGVEYACASVEIANGLNNPLVSALPEMLLVPLAFSGLKKAVDILFEEAIGQRFGRQPAVDRLFEYVLILLLRHMVEARRLDGGILAGLADEKLARAISLVHDHPEQTITVQILAQAAGMSRARFSDRFRKIVGLTPMAYSTDWRLSVARSLIKKGMPIKMVAPSVGYLSPAALTRAFVNKTGVSPRTLSPVRRRESKVPFPSFRMDK